jgi:SAM-dependent methyltransferase
MRARVERLMDKFYPVGPDGRRARDGTYPFYDWMLANVGPEATVLNVGAGPTPVDPQRWLRGKVGHLVGVDPDPVVRTNTDLDEAYVNDGTTLPFADRHFDAVYSDWTLEHVALPTPFLAEICRVLKPGASFWFRTVNRLHYVTVVSAMTPHWFHALVANRARALPSETHEPWPTRYRMNRESTLRRYLSQAGFRGIEIRMIEPEPCYMLFHPIPFVAGVGYERLVNRSEAMRPFRQVVLGRARR